MRTAVEAYVCDICGRIETPQFAPVSEEYDRAEPPKGWSKGHVTDTVDLCPACTAIRDLKKSAVTETEPEAEKDVYVCHICGRLGDPFPIYPFGERRFPPLGWRKSANNDHDICGMCAAILENLPRDQREVFDD